MEKEAALNLIVIIRMERNIAVKTEDFSFFMNSTAKAKIIIVKAKSGESEAIISL